MLPQHKAWWWGWLWILVHRDKEGHSSKRKPIIRMITCSNIHLDTLTPHLFDGGTPPHLSGTASAQSSAETSLRWDETHRGGIKLSKDKLTKLTQGPYSTTPKSTYWLNSGLRLLGSTSCFSESLCRRKKKKPLPLLKTDHEGSGLFQNTMRTEENPYHSTITWEERNTSCVHKVRQFNDWASLIGFKYLFYFYLYFIQKVISHFIM